MLLLPTDCSVNLQCTDILHCFPLIPSLQHPYYQITSLAELGQGSHMGLSIMFAEVQSHVMMLPHLYYTVGLVLVQ